jgi:DNA-directed RNA polymerase subunit beta
MATSLANDYRVRKSFGKIKHIVEIPNLIEMQRESYERFLQQEVDPDERVDKGLQGVFKGVFPIRDFSGTASLEFVRYSIGRVKYDVEECLQRGMTYEAPIKITVRLVVYDVDKDSGAKHIRDIKEQEVYFGTIPLMTNNGTFIVNGTERVVVSQLHRSPGIFFDHDKGKTHSSGKLLYSARIIPLRGSWIDMEFDPKDILHVRIDRRRKFPVTILLKALGYSAAELLAYFYQSERVYLRKDGVAKLLDDEFLAGTRSPLDITHPKSGKVLAKESWESSLSSSSKSRRLPKFHFRMRTWWVEWSGVMWWMRKPERYLSSAMKSSPRNIWLPCGPRAWSLWTCSTWKAPT